MVATAAVKEREMELRILGAHNMESDRTHFEAHLVDGVLALDAGSLTRTLTFEEQKKIRAILLSHRHFDHTRDLLPLGINIRDTGVTVEVYAINDTVDYVGCKLLDGTIYPVSPTQPTAENPSIRLNVVELYEEFKVLGYTAMAVPVPHAVPAAGFQLSSGDTTLFYTGDTGKGLSEVWKHVAPSVLLTEVTFGNENEGQAIEFGHLTPALLEEALADFKAERGYLPRVLVSHMNPPWESAVRTEIGALSSRLGIDITVTRAGMTVDL